MTVEVLPYSEGTVFAVPLRNGGFARGIVARAAPEGAVLFGYFFGPKLPSLNEADVAGVEPDCAIAQLILATLD